MGISGNIKTMVLAELLQWLSQGQKTGTLVIDNSQVTKRIFFDRGTIISSASTDPKEYLGRFLVNHGYLTDEQVNAAVARQKQEHKLLGQILSDMGAMNAEDVHQMLQLKAEESIYDIFTWPEGDFHFLDGELPAENMVPMQLDVQWIVLEGSRRMDELQRIRESVPSTQHVPVSVVPIEQMEVDEAGQRILGFVDDDRTVEEISQEAHSSEFLVSQLLAMQVTLGTIKMVRPRFIEVTLPENSDLSAEQLMEQTIMVRPPGQENTPGLPPGPSAGQPQATMAGNSGYIAVQQPGGGWVAQPTPLQGFNPQALAQQADPEPEPPSEAEQLLYEAEGHVAEDNLAKAFITYQQAKNADGADRAVLQAVLQGEMKINRVLDRAGVIDTAVPRLTCGLEQLTTLDISPQEGFMLTRVNGSYDIQHLTKISPMSGTELKLLFWRLKDSGHVEIR
ncbi:MAG: DUF4388 domain-containing protein [Acidobacteriota bacterium]